MGAGREKVRVAKALQSLPQIGEAFSEGRISYSKVRAMTRIANPKNEAGLLNVAFHGTAAHVEKLVRGYRRVREADELEAANTGWCTKWVSKSRPTAPAIFAFSGLTASRYPRPEHFPRRRPIGCAHLVAENRNQNLDIDAGTCIPHWEGETMDYGMALDGLLAANKVLAKDYGAWKAEV